MMGTPPSSHFGSKPGLPSHAGAVGRSLVGPRGLGASGAPVMAANAAAATAGAAEGKSVPAYRSFVQTMHTTRYTGDLPMPLRGGAFASDLIQRHGQQVLLARKLEMEMDREKSDLEELARRWYLKVRPRAGLRLLGVAVCCVVQPLVEASSYNSLVEEGLGVGLALLRARTHPQPSSSLFSRWPVARGFPMTA